MLEEFKLFSTQLKKEDKILIMHDTDADGISAGVLFHHFLSTYNISSIIPYFNEGGEKFIKDEMVEVVKKESINKVIILDVAVDGNPENLKKIEELVEKVVIIDHHPTLSPLTSHKTIFIKSDRLDLKFPPHYYNTSKLTYDLINFITPLQQHAWKASIGIIGDMTYKKWEYFVKRSWNNINDLMRCTELIEMATSLGKEGIEDSYASLLSSSTPPTLLKKLNKYKEIEKEIERVMKKLEGEAEIDNKNKIVFFSFTSPYDIKSIIANKVSLLFPHYTVIINQIKEDKGEISISLRNQLSHIHMGEIAQEVIRRLGKGRGGGHAPAAGITLPLQEYENFRNIIIHLINAHQKLK